MNSGRIPNIMILIGTNNVSRGSDEEDAQWESMMVCLFTTLAEIQMCGTDRLHRTNEHKNKDVDRKKT